MAAEVGHLDLAYDYLAEAAFMDLEDREHNTKDGLHIASLAGAWTALVSGFGGMRVADGQLCFAPKLPPGIIGLRFRMRYRDRIILVSVHNHGATYSLLSGKSLEINHYGDPLTVGKKEVTSDIPAPEQLPPPSQPAGRVPQPHRARND
jgi:alpha,alpha-trehalose phosphorylase